MTDLLEGELGRKCVQGRVWQVSLMVSSVCVTWLRVVVSL